ncbi:MAG: HK97 family phage prohead protease [Hyphomicrobiaceae bacterium]|nr:MAG: HK97 family phage prohead protease [Hyphomicrobiaceae bacterium]
MAIDHKIIIAGAGRQNRIMPSLVELREAMAEGSDQKKQCICGYAAKYNNITVLYSSKYYEYREVIMPGFFDDVLTNDVRCLKNHDPNLITGRTTANTLSISSDETGLYFDNEPDPEITYVSDLIRSVKRKEITQCSFSFTIKEQKWEELQVDEKWIYTRYLIKARQLYDVGPVTFPAYEDTVAEVDERSIEALQREVEEWRKANAPKEPQNDIEKLKQRNRKLWLLERSI